MSLLRHYAALYSPSRGRSLYARHCPVIPSHRQRFRIRSRRVTAETHSQLASFIWSICNLLRGPYKRNEYRKVILPLTVLRASIASSRPRKLPCSKNTPRSRAKPRTSSATDSRSPATPSTISPSSISQRLLDDPNQLAPNLNSYINGFSPNVRAIMERFDFGDTDREDGREGSCSI